MSHPFRTLTHRVLALALAGASFTAVPSAQAADDDRRALRIDEAEERAAQSAELKAMADAKRAESMELLKGLLADAEGDRKAEMLLRLASLYFEQGQSDFANEMDAYERAFDDCFNNSRTPDACDQIQVDNTKSFDWYRRAIKLYEKILKEHPRWAKADEATFYLGMTQNETKDRDGATESFKKLVKLYPSSAFVTDAYIMIGEYYFDKNEAFPALRAYLTATGNKEHPRWSFAMYKLAWCYYNVEEYDKAIDTMKAVVAFSMDAASGDKKSIRLEEEALQDLVRFFADAGQMDEAYDYFTKLGKKDLIRSMLERLAKLYFDQGKFDQSVLTYQRLIGENPTHKNNPSYQEDIISCYRKMGQKDKILEELRRLKTDYGKQSAWWKTNQSDPDALANADSIIEKGLRTTATTFNTEARELEKAKHPRAKEAFDQAIAAYHVYFEDYKDHPSSYNVHYDFAELLWKLKKYEDAYAEYMKVVTMDPNGQHSQFCAESAIFASEEMIKKEGGAAITTATGKVTKDQQPLPLTGWEQRMIDACRQYATLYPSSSKVETAIYKSAFLLFQRYHYTEASEQFRAVIKMNPGSQNAEYSAHLILSALEVREEWVSLRDAARDFWKQEGLGSSKFKKEMYDIYASSSFTVIEEDFKKVGDKNKTADAYMAFFAEFAEFPKLDFALNNAAAYYFQSDRVGDSMKVRHILIEDERFGPKSKFYYDQIGALGYDYERLADFDKASVYYDMLFSVFPSEKKKVEDDKERTDKEDRIATMTGKAADGLFSAAVFRNALGDWQGAISRYQTFLTSFPTDPRVNDAKVTIGKIYEDHKELTKASTAFEAFYKQPGDLPPEYVYYARLHHGRALLSAGQVTQARDLYKATVDLYTKAVEKGLQPGAYTEYVAEMKFELMKPDIAAYDAIDIPSVVKDGASLSGRALEQAQKKEDKAQKDALTAKTTAFVGLDKKYGEIIQMGSGPWGIASINGLARAYEEMATTLTSAPCPFYLTTEQCEFYKYGLEDRAVVAVQKAVETYEIGLQRAYELHLYNDDTAFATRALGRLRPNDFPGLSEELPKPGLTADKDREFKPEPTID